MVRVMGPPTAISQHKAATTSPDPYSKPAGSDPEYTPDCEEPGNRHGSTSIPDGAFGDL
jgi:hypothetical protein